MGEWMKTKRGFDSAACAFRWLYPLCPTGHVLQPIGARLSGGRANLCLSGESRNRHVDAVPYGRGAQPEKFTLCEKSCVKQPAYNLHASFYRWNVGANSGKPVSGAKFTFDPQNPQTA